MSLSLRQLSVLTAVADGGSISRAAARLHISQPAVTRHIRAIERSLGIRILDRDGRGIKLTPSGVRLERHARDILDLHRNALADLREIAKESAGKLLVGLPSPVESLLSSRLIAAAAKEFPRLQLDVHAGWTGFIRDWLLSGRMDIGLVYDDPENSTLMMRPLVGERLSLVGARSEAILGRGPLRLKNIAELPMILPSHRRGIRYIYEHALARHGLRPKIVMEIDSGATIRSLLTRGGMFSLFPKREIVGKAESAQLASALVTDPPLWRQIYIVRSLDSQFTKTVRSMEKIIVAQTQELVRRGLWLARLS